MSANRTPSSTSLCTRSKQGLESRVQGTNTEADAESRHVGFITRCPSHIHSLGQLCASRRARLYLPCCLLTSPHLSSLSLCTIALAFWVDLMSCLPAHLFISAPAHLFHCSGLLPHVVPASAGVTARHHALPPCGPQWCAATCALP